MERTNGWLVSQTLQQDLDAGDPLAKLYRAMHPEVPLDHKRYLQNGEGDTTTPRLDEAFRFSTRDAASRAAANAVQRELQKFSVHSVWNIEDAPALAQVA